MKIKETNKEQIDFVAKHPLVTGVPAGSVLLDKLMSHVVKDDREDKEDKRKTTSK